jgi:hypothetical protein
MTAWPDLLERARQLAPGVRESVRLANLSVAAQAAAFGGHYGRRRRLDGPGLIDAVSALMVEPLDLDTDDLLTWSALAADARDAALAFSGSDGTDAWVQAFQGADPGRKSRGAYATPRTLARPMARLLLRGGSVPDRVVDPSAGAGALLVAVLYELRRTDRAASPAEHARRLHGVELDPIARELCCVLVWLAAEQQLSIAEVADRIIVGNAITRDWWADEAYDAVIMNPPWDSLRHAATGDEAGELERDATIERLATEQQGAADLPPLYSAQGRGDRNLYKAFVELAPHLVCHGGRVVALIPGAWSSDLGTRHLRRAYFKQLAIDQWTSFENLRGYFPIDGRYKFGILAGSRTPAGTGMVRTRGFAADAVDLRRSHVIVHASDVPKIGGSSWIIPDLTSRAEAQLMLRCGEYGCSFFDPAGPFGEVRYDREVDLTQDRKRGLFDRLENTDAQPVGDGHWRAPDGRTLVPLMEGRMVGQYDFHEKSWVEGSGRTAVWTYTNGHRLGTCRPQFLIEPTGERRHRIAICDVTSATNTRTVLATWVPADWRCGNTAPVLVFDSERRALAALAVLNSMVFDWLARRLVAGLHLNRFYLEALSWPTLTDDQVDTLAGTAAALQQLGPRYQDLRAPRIMTAAVDLELVDAHAVIEGLVADGYGLTTNALEVIYSSDPKDRRGLWRHFASDPHAQPIVDAVMRTRRGRVRTQSEATAVVEPGG